MLRCSCSWANYRMYPQINKLVQVHTQMFSSNAINKAHSYVQAHAFILEDQSRSLAKDATSSPSLPLNKHSLWHDKNRKHRLPRCFGGPQSQCKVFWLILGVQPLHCFDWPHRKFTGTVTVHCFFQHVLMDGGWIGQWGPWGEGAGLTSHFQATGFHLSWEQSSGMVDILAPWAPSMGGLFGMAKGWEVKLIG